MWIFACVEWIYEKVLIKKAGSNSLYSILLFQNLIPIRKNMLVIYLNKTLSILYNDLSSRQMVNLFCLIV